MTYSEKLKDPRWQKKRLEILNRDNFSCWYCGDSKSTLHVHHEMYFSGDEPWETPDECLSTVCEDCHDFLHIKFSPIEKFLISAVWNRDGKEMVGKWKEILRRIKINVDKTGDING